MSKIGRMDNTHYAQQRNDMAKLQFIKGAPLRDPSYFVGPVAWWADSLTCGGVERQIVAAGREFKKKGFPITLLCRTASAEGGNDFFLQEAQACCKSVVPFSPDMLDGEIFLKARGIMEAFIEGASLVFRDSVAAYAAWLLQVRPRLLQIWNADHLVPLLAAIIAGVPRIIIAGQSLSPAQRAPYGFESVDEDMAFVILSNALRLTDVVMTNNSRAGCEAYEAWLGFRPRAVALTPNIFDMDEWKQPSEARIQGLRNALGIPAQARVLGGLFRFVSIKDPWLWVNTAIRACTIHKDLYAVVGGHGPELDPIRESLSHTPVASRILFPGSIKDVPAFLSLCSVFLHTSYVEGLPNALLEAHASEVPVVTTRCGGAADVVEHGKSGFVVDSHDDVLLARYVKHLLDHDDAARQAGKIGKERVARLFSPRRGVNALLRVYAGLLPGMPAGDLDHAKDTETLGHKEGSVTLEANSPDAESPLVSIVVPIAGSADGLEATVTSILDQRYGKYELIIVHDGQDSCLQKRLTCAAGRYVLIEGGNGLAESLNIAFAGAGGDFFTWVLPGNILLPDFCGTLAAALRAFPQASLASAAFARVNSEGFVTERFTGTVYREDMLCGTGEVAAFMYRKKAAQQAGNYDPLLAGAEAWDMWLRLEETGASVHVPRVLGRCSRLYGAEAPASGATPDKARMRAAFRAWQRLKAQGGVASLYPQIEHCHDRNQAIFDANLALGIKMLGAQSVLKAAAVSHLEIAHALFPDNIAALGNYAIALAWHGRFNEADTLFRHGAQFMPEQFAKLQEHCNRQRRLAGTLEFFCEPLAGAYGAGELMRRMHKERLVFGGTSVKMFPATSCGLEEGPCSFPS